MARKRGSKLARAARKCKGKKGRTFLSCVRKEMKKGKKRKR